MKELITALLMLFTLAVSAEDVVPVKCQPLAVLTESLILNPQKPSVILINNVSKSELWITHPVTNPSASAGWSSQLGKGKWSALAVDKGPFEVSCIESVPGHEQQVSCVAMIEACELKKIKMPESAKGTFWVGENMSKKSLMTLIGSKGFELS